MSARHTQCSVVRSLSLSLGLLVDLLLLESGRLREFEGDSVSGEASVSVGHSIETLLHYVFVQGVQEDLLEAAALNSDTGLATSHG